MTIEGVNEQPVLANVESTQASYFEGSSGVVVSPSITLDDVDSPTMERAVVTVADGFSSGDMLAFSDTAAITGTYNSGTGVLTLDGTDSTTDYQDALRSVKFQSSGAVGSGKRIDFQTDDGEARNDLSNVVGRELLIDKAPVAANDAETVGEDATATAFDVLANDSNPDGGPLVIASATDPAHGTVALTGGSPGAHTGLTYTPDPNYCNDPPGTTEDTFDYTLNGGSVGMVEVTVTCVDDQPVAVNDSPFPIDEDASATAIDVLANDTPDPDGQPTTISSTTQPANGTVALTGGTPGNHTGLTYQPDPNYCNNPPSPAADTFTYTINGGSTATVSMSVTCIDDSPVAVNDSATLNEDAGPTTVNVLANDTDIDGGPKTINNKTDGTKGTVVIAPDGLSLAYTPAANECGGDSFTYTLNGGSTATVNVTINCVNDPPVAVNDAATVNEDAPATAINVLGNDTDAESDAITISSASDPANGTVVVTGGGTGLTYQPDPNYCNSNPSGTPDTFTYEVNGGSTATVSVTVTCVNDPTNAVNDTATVVEDSGTTNIDVLSNDSDPDTPLSISSITQPANGTATITGGGTGVSYAPNANYCNDPPGGIPDTFTYTVNGQTATVSVTVTCQNDAPAAVNDSASVTEDSGANAINVLGNDTDAENDAITITSSTQPANGTVVLTGPAGAHTGLTYQPNPNYCNNPPGTSPDTFTYTVNGGSTATVSVTVDCFDDPPTAVNDSDTVDEDSAPNAIDVLGNDTDPDGGPKSITSVTQPTNGTVVITGGGTGVTYEPNANYCNNPPGGSPDTFNYTLTPGGSTATVSVTVDCLPEPAVVDTSNTPLTFNEGDPATAVDPAVTVSDPSPVVNITEATVAISANYQSTADVLALPAGVTYPNITGTYNSGTGVLTLTGSTTAAEYQNALQAVTFANASNAPSPLTRTVTFTVKDAGTPSQTSAPATRDINVVPDDDDPTAVNDAATVLEDSGANPIDVLGNDTDPDGGPKSITAVTQPTNGTVVITGGGTGLTYAPNANYCNTAPPAPTDDFTYTLTPGGSTATVAVTVTCVTEPPVVTTTSGAMQYAEDEQPLGTPAENHLKAVDPALSIAAGDTPNMASASAEITGAYATGQDFLEWTDPDGNGTGIDLDPASTAKKVILTGAGTTADYEAALQDVRYQNTSDNPSATNRTVTFLVTDANTQISAPKTRDIQVSPTDDDPDAQDDSATVGEDSGANTIDVLANDNDPDGGTKLVIAKTNGTRGTVAITNGGNDVSYTPNANECGTDSFTYDVTGGDTATVNVTITPCLADRAVVTPTPSALAYTENDPPTKIDTGVALSDVDDPDDPITTATVEITGNYQAGQDFVEWTDNSLAISRDNIASTDGKLVLTGTASLSDYQAVLRDVTYRNNSEAPSPPTRTVTFSVTDDDALTSLTAGATRTIEIASVDDPPVAVSDSATVDEDSPVNNLSVLANDTDLDGGSKEIASVTDPPNGTATIVQGAPDQINYVPDANYCGSDSFNYTLTPGSSSTTVSMTVTCINDAPVADDETFDSANRAVGNTALVGNDPSDGAHDPAGPQKTITADVLSGDTDVDNAAADLSVHPESKATNDGGSVTIDADGDFTYHPKVGTSCTDTSDFFDYTVKDNHPTDPRSDVGRVTIAIADCVWYVDASAPAGGDGRSHTPLNSLTSLNGAGGAGDSDATVHKLFLYDGTYTTGLTLEADQKLLGEQHGLTVPSGGAGDISLVTAGGGDTTLNGGLVLASGNEVQAVDLGNHSSAALSGSTVGNAKVNTVTSGTINNANGGAVAINGSGSSMDLRFSSLSASGAATGISLTNTGGDFDADAGTLNNGTHTSADVALSGGTTNFTYDGGISDDQGQLVSISNQTAGTKDFNGNITDGNDNDGGGISLSSNTGATIRFDGGLTLDTGATNALAATGGGTLAVTDPAGATENIIETTTGIALNVANTNIHSDDLTFRKVDSNGSATGIVLNTTGNAGGLTVTGTDNGQGCTGANFSGCTGGTIQSTTDAGVALTSVGGGVSLTRMRIANGTGDGVRGTTVNGFSMGTGVVSNNGDNSDNNERGFDFANLSGTASFSSLTVSSNREDGMKIAQTAGSVNATVTGGNWSNTIKNDGILLDADGGTSHALTVQGATFNSNHGDHVQVASDPTSVGTSVTSTVQGNTMTGSAAVEVGISGSVGGGVTVGGTQKANITSTVTQNTISGTEASGIDHTALSHDAVIEATVSNNTVNSPGSDGLKLEAAGNGTIRSLVENNAVGVATGHPVAYNFAGIEVFSKETADIDATIRNNTISGGHSVNSTNGLRVQSGFTGSTDTATVCVDAGGATAALKNTLTGSSPAAGQTDIRMIHRGNTTMKLPGLSPSPTTNTATVNGYMTSRNTAADASSAINSGPGVTGTVINGTCTLP